MIRCYPANAEPKRKIDSFRFCTQSNSGSRRIPIPLTKDAQPVGELHPVDPWDLDDGRSDGEDVIEAVPLLGSERFEVRRDHRDPAEEEASRRIDLGKGKRSKPERERGRCYLDFRWLPSGSDLPYLIPS
jgi:hypothetical protein